MDCWLQNVSCCLFPWSPNKYWALNCAQGPVCVLQIEVSGGHTVLMVLKSWWGTEIKPSPLPFPSWASVLQQLRVHRSGSCSPCRHLRSLYLSATLLNFSRKRGDADEAVQTHFITVVLNSCLHSSSIFENLLFVRYCALRVGMEW